MAKNYIGAKKLKQQLERDPNVRNPGGVIGKIGRQKYGAKRFNQAAAKGKSLRGAPAKKR